GLYVGGISGGMIPAALLKIPGTPSSVATTFDTYPMAQKGFAEKALKIGIVASIIGGLISLVVLYFFAPVLGPVAINFTPVETFVSLIGVFPTNNGLRMVPSFLEDYLWDGFSLLPVLIGLFGISEILRNSEQGLKTDTSKKVSLKKAKSDPEAKFSLKEFKG